ncbi:Major Facilitator Superfamily protein [Paenibacillus konkukensis]|uniref:Major Facilitator Superfamily protein n=1 Tax=Paenibacillus konkukensis TaxID=2020716 RepID=A0ABY4RZK8_9BACL|nr:MFS transporter [Paenibacillus konkukensis]UQZ87109.1 Major Facilitator Superfamily protein [Paenibacillus konkukensis]
MDRNQTSKNSPKGHGLSRNIPLFYLYQLCNSFILDRGIWMLYLVSCGFSLAEIGVIEALYHGVVFLFEIPTGYLADRYGKKSSLLIAQLLGMLSAGCLMLSSGAPFIIAGFLLGGFVGTLQSGATNALLYETLQAQGQEHRFKQRMSYGSAIMLISMGISGSFGGFLSDMNWEWVYGGKALVHLLTLLILLPVIDPVTLSNKPSPAGGSTRIRLQGVTELTFAGQLKVGYSFIRSNRPFLTLSLFGGLLYSMAWSITFYSQVLFQNVGFPNKTIGTFNGIETWVSAAITAAAYLVERRIGKTASLITSGIGFTVFLIVLAGSSGAWPVVLSFFMLSVFISYLEPLLEAYLNDLVPASLRATMLSVFSMMISTGMMATFLILGVLADRGGVSHAIQTVLLLWVPLLIVLLLWCLRHIRKA